MRFFVRGSGPFPYDMLRYDRCYPAGPGDAAAIKPTHLWDERTICLFTEARTITPDRWRSFGWSANETNIWEN